MNEKCNRTYTTIYSQPSIEALENLVNEFLNTFGIPKTINDLFNYGVFCKPQNYANFNYGYGVDGNYDFEIPATLTSLTTPNAEKLDYVKTVINLILDDYMKKPEWMTFVEMNQVCDRYGQAPSTFLYIRAKDNIYSKLADRLIEFLYSPNMNMTMVKA